MQEQLLDLIFELDGVKGNFRADQPSSKLGHKFVKQSNDDSNE